MKSDTAGFRPKNPVFRILGQTVPKRPKMAQNGPKVVVNQIFLENGSNDFPDFWPEVGGQYSKKVDPRGFFPKNPVFLDLGLTVPKRPKNLFFEIWSIYIVIIYENEALGLEKNKKLFLEFFCHFWAPLSARKALFGPKMAKNQY